VCPTPLPTGGPHICASHKTLQKLWGRQRRRHGSAASRRKGEGKGVAWKSWAAPTARPTTEKREVVKKDKNAGRCSHRLVWGRVLVQGRCRWRAHLITLLLYDLHGTVAAGAQRSGAGQKEVGAMGGQLKKNTTPHTNNGWQGLAALLLGGGDA
jgi:hypothetical protein